MTHVIYQDINVVEFGLSWLFRRDEEDSETPMIYNEIKQSL